MLRNAVDAVSLAGVPVALIACAAFHVKSAGLLTFVAALAGIAIFFGGWEASKPPLRQVLPVVVLSALAAAGRVVFAPIPNVQPVTAICIIAGAVFGKREGFMTGALAALVSNCFLGQGAWTPWQMYAWGLVGYVAGVLFCRGTERAKGRKDRNARWSTSAFWVCIYGFVASFAYGFILSTWTLVGFVGDVSFTSIAAVYGSSAVFDIAHAISTVAFVALLYAPWSQKLSRIKMRYAL